MSTNKKVYSFHYTLFDTAGTQLESSVSKEPLIFLAESGQIIPGLEKEIITMKVGDKKKVQVTSAEAYGDIRNDLIVEITRNQLPPGANVKIGDQFKVDDSHHSPVFQVKSIVGDKIVLDGNHPMAGKNLIFDVELMLVREATKEEVNHGHAHGEHGHSHH
jgi:FKBP-type peptidyl-prolyl cis-trans isomerase SlyD